jgi:maleylacetoacetate isomerase
MMFHEMNCFTLLRQVYNAVRFGVDMTQFPTVARVNQHLVALQEFIAAHPQQQGDAPPDC